MNLVIGGRYNWKCQRERLVYLGRKGLWHQFALIEKPHNVWCEVLEESLVHFEETVNETAIVMPCN